MGVVVHAVSDLRPLSLVAVAKSQGIRGSEVRETQQQQRARAGRALDWFILDLILEIVSLLIVGLI